MIRKIKNNRKVSLIIVGIMLMFMLFASVIYITFLKSKDNNFQFNNNSQSNNNNNFNDTVLEYDKDMVTFVVKYDEIIKFENHTYPYNDMSNRYLLVKQNDRYGLIDYDGNIIEEIKYDIINYLVDDYYYIELDGIKTLKRNGKKVADITKYEKDKFYKDTSDPNSLYIMLNEYMYNKSEVIWIEESENIVLDDNIRAVYYKDSQKIADINVTSSSIVYNALTGNIIKKIPGQIKKDDEGNYMVTYDVSTYMRKNTKYDKKFNNLLPNDYYFYSAQCDGNGLFPVVTDGVDKKYGYYSVNNKKLILPIEYRNIYSVNSDETLFVVKNEKKYALVDNNNKYIFQYEYDYITIENDYIITVKDGIMNIYDNNLNILPNYTFEINTSKEIAVGGMCEAEYKYIDYQSKIGDNASDVLYTKLVVSTTDGLKTLLFYDKKIKLFDNYQYVTTGYNNSEEKNYIIISNIDDNIIDNISLYDVNLNKIYDINVSISLTNNILSFSDSSYLNNISFEFDCKNFKISYKDNNEMKSIYYNLGQNKIVEENKYNYCKKINDDYFYYPIYNEERYHIKNKLIDSNENMIIEFKQDIDIVDSKHILIDKSELYLVK